MRELEGHGARFRFSHYAEAADVLAEEPDVVFVATGGIPNNDILESGNDLVASSWDVLSGQVKPAESVLLFDDNGGYPGMSAGELIAESGSDLEIVSPERFFAPEMGGLNHAAFAEVFDRRGVRITVNSRLLAVRRDGNKLVAVVGSNYSDRRSERRVDQVVVKHGTLPLAELYDELKALSVNGGEVDYKALLGGRSRAVRRNPEGSFGLFRLGDAVASRNIHAAIYDGIRFAKDL
jgi:pyruvate/2-oxoglutarate dehydrogenase complex dihydrolipoamide dehydrogenase (E3) component